MPQPPKAVVGVAWFRPDQWHLLRAVAIDAHKLEQTHAAWEALAERRLKDLAAEGLIARKVDVDVEALVEWCRMKQRPLDGAARAEYACDRIQEEDQRS